METFEAPRTKAALKALHRLFSRLVKLRPVLDDLEITDGSDDKAQQIVQETLMQSQLLISVEWSMGGPVVLIT